MSFFVVVTDEKRYFVWADTHEEAEARVAELTQPQTPPEE